MKAGEFLNYKNWVVVGDVLNQGKYAYRILNALKRADFNVAGVNPKEDNVNIYKNIQEVSYKIDVIDLCINPIIGLKVIERASELGINKVLIQPGAESNEILKLCKDKNITAIQGCALVELSNYDFK